MKGFVSIIDIRPHKQVDGEYYHSKFWAYGHILHGLHEHIACCFYECITYNRYRWYAQFLNSGDNTAALLGTSASTDITH